MRAPADPRSHAPTPRRAPVQDRGVVEVLRRVWQDIRDNDVTGQAAKLAYYAFLALPPALMALFAVAGLFQSVDLALWLESQARLVMPPEVVSTIIRPFIHEVVLQNAPGPLSVGLLLALWGGSAVFAGLMDALNRAYDIEESRPFLRKRALAVGVMAAAVVLLLVAAVALLAGPAIADVLGVGAAAAAAWNVVQWPLAFAFVVAAFFLGYRVLPNRDQAGSSAELLKAAAVAAALWVAATAGFRFYIARFGSYGETYGFLGAFIVLLLWLYVTSLVVLVGGELAAEMERRG